MNRYLQQPAPGSAYEQGLTAYLAAAPQAPVYSLPPGAAARLDPCTLQGDTARSAAAAQWAALLRRGPYPAALARRLEAEAGRIRFPQSRLPLNPADGMHLRWLVSLDESIQRDRDGIRRILDLTSAFPAQADEALRTMRACARAGLLLPPDLLEPLRQQLAWLAACPPAQHPAYTALARNLSRANPAEIREFEAAAFLADGAGRIETQVQPAVRRLLAFADSLAALPPAGDAPFRDTAWLAWSRSRYLPATLSPERLGSDAFRAQDSLRRAVDAQLDLAGSPPGPLHARLRSAWQRAGAPPEPEILRELAHTAFQLSAGMFDSLRFSRVSVEYAPAWRMPDSAAFRYVPHQRRWLAAPGAPAPILQAGAVFASVYPGRHLFESWQRRRPDSAFHLLFPDPASEQGWELYALWLMDREVAYYSGQDPMPALAYRCLLHEAAALAACDAGLHVQGWTPGEGAAWLAEQLGISRAAAQVRMASVWLEPGRSAAAWYGFQRLLEFRQLAASRLGSRFFLQEFHAWYLRQGPADDPALRTALESWISAKLAGELQRSESR
ncbi:MAG: DUF885 family protein [Bacteroidia bacterium]|nr:DUF885 family protein [Bacteroidia bacterium]